MNNASMSEPAADQDSLLFSEAVPTEKWPSPKRRYKKPLKRDMVLWHLRSGEPLSRTEARRLYRVANLASTVSWLARAYGMKIGKTRHIDEYGVPYVSYFLISEGDAPGTVESSSDTDDLSQYEEEAEVAEIDTKAAGGTTNVSIADIRMRSGGIELLLVGDGEADDKPFYRLSPAQAKLLRVNLNLFAELAESP